MAFWGASIPGNGSYTIPSQVPPRRLRITHASHFGSNSDFLRLDIKVGDNQPIPVAIGNGSTKLKLEFEEPNDVLLSVVGPTDVHLVGFYYQTNQGQDFYPTKIGSKNRTSIYLESDDEPRRGKLTKKVADMDSMECNILVEKHDRNEQTSMVNIQGNTSVNEPQKQQTEPSGIDAIVPLILIPERGCDLTGRKKQKKRELVSEEKIQEDPIPLEPSDDGIRQVKTKETKKKMTRKLTGEAEDIVEDSSNKCVIGGRNDEHKATDASDFSINAQEKEEAIIVEIARHHSEAFQDVDTGVQSSERENMADKLDETQVLGVTSADEKLSSDATVCAKRGCDLDVMGIKKKEKRKLVSEEKIQEDPIPLEQGDDLARPVKRTAAKKKKTRRVTSGEAEDIIEDSGNKKNSDLVPAKENKQAKKDKYIFISREEQLVDTSKMNDDTFEALPTKVKSAKTKRNKPITSEVPNEQSKADFPHIVLGLASSRIVPNK